MATRNQRLIEIQAIDAESGCVNAIIDTPKLSRNKFKYDESTQLFKLSGVLPLGTYFPFDFGYIPSTIADDGDPLDVLVLMDEPAFTGCLVQSKLIGVIEAEQTEKGRTARNDRLIGVASESHNHSHIRFLGDLNSNLLHEIEQFFVSYNQTKGKEFKIVGRAGPERAGALIDKAVRDFKNPRYRRRGALGGVG